MHSQQIWNLNGRLVFEGQGAAIGSCSCLEAVGFVVYGILRAGDDATGEGGVAAYVDVKAAITRFDATGLVGALHALHRAEHRGAQRDGDAALLKLLRAGALAGFARFEDVDGLGADVDVAPSTCAGS